MRDELVEADEEFVQPLIDFFNRKFKWTPGEYTFEVTVRATPAKADITKRYYAILFEYDCDTLREHVDGFKYGRESITTAIDIEEYSCSCMREVEVEVALTIVRK